MLKAMEMANERRDRILDTESKLTLEHRWLMLYSDWVGIFLGAHCFLGFIVMLLLFSPSFVSGAHENVKLLAGILFFITGGIFVIIMVLGFTAGVGDFIAMRKHLLKVEFKKW